MVCWDHVCCVLKVRVQFTRVNLWRVCVAFCLQMVFKRVPPPDAHPRVQEEPRAVRVKVALNPPSSPPAPGSVVTLCLASQSAEDSEGQQVQAGWSEV